MTSMSSTGAEPLMRSQVATCPAGVPRCLCRGVPIRQQQLESKHQRVRAHVRVVDDSQRGAACGCCRQRRQSLVILNKQVHAVVRSMLNRDRHGQSRGVW